MAVFMNAENYVKEYHLSSDIKKEMKSRLVVNDVMFL